MNYKYKYKYKYKCIYIHEKRVVSEVMVIIFGFFFHLGFRFRSVCLRVRANLLVLEGRSGGKRTWKEKEGEKRRKYNLKLFSPFM